MKPIIDPTRKHIAGNEESVFYPDHETSSMGCSNFSLDNGNNHAGKADSNTLDSAAGYKASKVWGEGLDEG